MDTSFLARTNEKNTFPHSTSCSIASSDPEYMKEFASTYTYMYNGLVKGEQKLLRDVIQGNRVPPYYSMYANNELKKNSLPYKFG